MSYEPYWKDGKLLCGSPTCGQEMTRTASGCVCVHCLSRIFPVPAKPPRQPKQKTTDPVAEWKKLLPLARSQGRRKEPGGSIALWRVAGDPSNAWTSEVFDVLPDCKIPDGWMIAAFPTTGTSRRTVLLRPIEMSFQEMANRNWSTEPWQFADARQSGVAK